MNRWNARIWVGAGLLLLGLLMLVERLGILRGITGLFFGALFLLGGAYFVYRFVNDVRGEWWAIIPGLALVGIGVGSLLSGVLSNWSGFFFLGALGLSFFAIYWSRREFWWAIIPGGVLLSVAALIAIAVGSKDGFAAVSVLFLGMAATFLVVYVATRQRWTFWPAGVLAILGTLFLIGAAGIAQYLWPLILVVAGAYLVFRSLPKKQ